MNIKLSLFRKVFKPLSPLLIEKEVLWQEDIIGVIIEGEVILGEDDILYLRG